MSAVMGEWTEQAACTGTPEAWWFPTTASGGDLDNIVPTEAAALCGACPVRDDCHRHALLHEPYGVWAATSSADRRRLRRSAGIRLRQDDDIVRQERARLMADNGTPPPVHLDGARRDPPLGTPLPHRPDRRHPMVGARR